MQIDRVKWNAERNRVEGELRELKSRRGEPHRPRWTCGEDDRSFPDLRRQATLLYRIRAHLRRRIHTAGMTSEAQEERVKASLPLYGLASEVIV